MQICPWNKNSAREEGISYIRMSATHDWASISSHVTTLLKRYIAHLRRWIKHPYILFIWCLFVPFYLNSILRYDALASDTMQLLRYLLHCPKSAAKIVLDWLSVDYRKTKPVFHFCFTVICYWNENYLLLFVPRTFPTFIVVYLCYLWCSSSKSCWRGRRYYYLRFGLNNDAP